MGASRRSRVAIARWNGVPSRRRVAVLLPGWVSKSEDTVNVISTCAIPKGTGNFAGRVTVVDAPAATSATGTWELQNGLPPAAAEGASVTPVAVPVPSL